MITKGQTVKIAFDLTVDGKLIRSVHSTKPLCFVYGSEEEKEIPAALQKAIRHLHVGDRRQLMLSPKQAHGEVNPESFVEMPKSRISTKFHFIGKEVPSQKEGKRFGMVKDIKKDTIVINLNHPLAGKSLKYDVLVVGIQNKAGKSLPRLVTKPGSL